jgi:hypothetical protein
MRTTSGFSKEKYDGLLTVLFLVIPFTLIILFFAAFESGHYFGGKLMEICGIIEIVIMFLIELSLILGVLASWFGVRAYKVYAAQVIDFDKSNKIERIKVNDSSLAIDYSEGNEVKVATIVFKDYDIEVHRRKSVQTPTFYRKKGLIKKVIIPYSTEDNASWKSYEIR